MQHILQDSQGPGVQGKEHGVSGKSHRNAADIMLILAVALIAILPSGSMFGVPVKYLLLLFIVFRFMTVSQHYLCALPAHLIGITAFLMLYALLGLSAFGLHAISELSLAVSAIVLALLIVHILQRRCLGRKVVLDIYRLSIMLLGVLKLFILAAFLLSPSYSAFQSGFVTAYQHITGASFVTMELPYGLVRIYLQNDLIAALFPLAVVILRDTDTIHTFDRVLVILCLVIVLLGFSRFNMACYGLTLMMFFWKDQKGLVFKLMFALMVLISLPLLLTEIIKFIELRFFSEHNVVSDQIRNHQADALIQLFKSAPVIGHGLGAYTEEVIRSPSAPFSYEQQVLSLLPKWGVLGSLIATGYVGYLFWRLAYARAYYTALYLALFILASLFNPYLFSSNMVIVYLLVFYMYFRQALHPVSGETLSCIKNQKTRNQQVTR